MKVAIIIPGNILLQPYIIYFTSILDLINIDYDYICWSRDGGNPAFINNHKVISIEIASSINNSFFKKTIDYRKFSKEVIKILNNNKYDYLIIHTIPIAFFLKKYIIKQFKYKYILDIRDYSPLFPLIRKSIDIVIKFSGITTISSKGFLTWLPKYNNYLLSHNVTKTGLESSNFLNYNVNKENISVLTIGQLRDFHTNKKIIQHLGNKPRIQMKFSGSGISELPLKEFSKKNKIKNIIFTGKYEKDFENKIVENSDFVNIMLPNNILSNTLMSNRFYLALINNKPMIVNESSVQAEYVKKYNLGLIIKDGDDIFEKLIDYTNNYLNQYNVKQNLELKKIIEMDLIIFEKCIFNYFNN